MHYRVSIYNYFNREFASHDWTFLVRANRLQPQNTHPIEFDFKQIPFYLINYVNEIKRVQPDVVILFLHLRDTMIWPLAHWLKMRRIPWVFWTKGINLDKPDSRISRLMYGHMHGLSDAMILYSEHERRYISQHNRNKIFVANNTLNFDDFPDILQSRQEIKDELGIPFRKTVLSVGRMGAAGRRKKIDHLMETFRAIDDPDVGLVVVGSGVSEQQLSTENRSNIIYLGEVHDPSHLQISKIFKMSDVFSIPGHVGLGLNQAMFWGLPVVTEEGGQPPEIHYLIDGRNGFIVPANDRAALRRKICHLLANDAVREEFGRNARADILAMAPISGMFEGFLRCVESLVASKNARDDAV
jgi:glycosyltransferase involved in cell wall biosynthesis